MKRLAGLPPVPVVTGEYRALTVYHRVPHDCGTVLVPDDRFAPHLRPGELAIVDPEDNEPVPGEIFVITVSAPMEPDGIALRFAQIRHEQCDVTGNGLWWMRFGLAPLAIARTFGTMEAAARAPSAGLSDGPMNEGGMRRKIVGRVVGVGGSSLTSYHRAAG